MYQLLIYRSWTQHKLISLQYRTDAVVGAEAEIRPQQLAATQLQWTMNAASLYAWWTVMPACCDFTWHDLCNSQFFELHHFPFIGAKHGRFMVWCGGKWGIKIQKHKMQTQRSILIMSPCNINQIWDYHPWWVRTAEFLVLRCKISYVGRHRHL